LEGFGSASGYRHSLTTRGEGSNSRKAHAAPFNSAMEVVLLEMGTQRIRPNDPHEHFFPRRYREPDKFFRRAVKRA